MNRKTNGVPYLGVLLVAMAFHGNQAWGSSFDCNLARSPVEKMVCGDPTVSRLDEDLALVFRATVASNPQARQQQSDWLRNTREQCQNTACLVDAYKKRIQVISGSQGVPAPASTAVSGNSLTPSAPSQPTPSVQSNVAQNPLSVLIDAKSFIGGNQYTQNGYWENPRNEVFGKRTVDWTDEDFLILESKLRAQIDIERSETDEYYRKRNTKRSADEDSVFLNKKKYLDDAIAAIPKYKIYMGLAREKVRAEEAQRLIEAQKRQDDELKYKQQHVQQAAETQQRTAEASRKDNLLIFGLIVAAIGAGWFWNKFIRNRCPKCKSADAETIGEEELDRWVGNKTVQEKHSRGTNTRTVKATYVKMQHQYRCRACQHQWIKESKTEL